MKRNVDRERWWKIGKYHHPTTMASNCSKSLTQTHCFTVTLGFLLSQQIAKHHRTNCLSADQYFRTQFFHTVELNLEKNSISFFGSIKQHKSIL